MRRSLHSGIASVTWGWVLGSEYAWRYVIGVRREEEPYSRESPLGSMRAVRQVLMYVSFCWVASVLLATLAQATDQGSIDAGSADMVLLERLVAGSSTAVVDAAQLATVTNRLRDNAKGSAPLLVAVVADKRAPLSRRVNSLNVLEDRRFVPHVGAKERNLLADLVDDGGDDRRFRGEVARFLAGRFYSGLSRAQREAIKRFVISQYDALDEAACIVVLSKYVGDSEVEAFLSGRLDRATYKNGVIELLGELRCRAALPVLVGMLRRGTDDRSVSKVGVIHAVGRIGGEEAYDALATALSQERESDYRRQVIWAMGETRTRRARAFLLDRLKKDRGAVHAICRGIEALGDPSVIPDLEAIARHGQTAYGERRIRKAIDHLRSREGGK